MVLDIVERYEVETQEELIRILQNKGVFATQATLSRDIKELGLVKASGVNKKFSYTIPKKEREKEYDLNAHFGNAVQSVASANNLVVIKTLAANGNSVAAIIDNGNYPDILGTIAGDDTVLVIGKDEQAAQIFAEKIMPNIK